MKDKINSFLQKKSVRKIAAIGCAIVVMAMSCVTCFAAEVSPDTVDSLKTGVTSLFGEITSVFSFGNLLQFIAIGVVAAATIVLGYIGLRKLVRMITSALKGRFKTL